MRVSIINSGLLAALSTALSTDQVDKRLCGRPLLNGGGPIPGNGSVPEYLNAGGPLRQSARNATTPAGYSRSFVDSLGATNDEGYLTYRVLQTSDLDTAQCAQICDSYPSCQAFNIYYAREPKYEQGVGCLDPEPVTNVKCALYAYAVAPKSGTNVAQESKDAAGKTIFTHVNVGSNGYNKASALAYYAPVPMPRDRAIESPAHYITYKAIDGAAWAAQETCAKTCNAYTAAGKNCVMFNIYERVVNGQSNATICALYDAAAGNATNGGDSEAGVVIRESSAWAVYDWQLYNF